MGVWPSAGVAIAAPKVKRERAVASGVNNAPERIFSMCTFELLKQRLIVDFRKKVYLG